MLDEIFGERFAFGSLERVEELLDLGRHFALSSTFVPSKNKQELGE